MPALIHYRDRDNPDLIITGQVVRRVDTDDGQWCLCQPTHDPAGGTIRHGVRYQQWVHVDDIEPDDLDSLDSVVPGSSVAAQ